MAIDLTYETIHAKAKRSTHADGAIIGSNLRARISRIDTEEVLVYMFGNLIAEIGPDELWVMDSGHHNMTVSMRKRLNQIIEQNVPGNVRITQENGVWIVNYADDTTYEWDGLAAFERNEN